MNTRQWIWQALAAICLEGAYSNLYLQQHLKQVKEEDRALATQVVYGTLQNMRLLRWQWEAYVRRMPSARVALLLDLSVYQLLFLERVPDYAVISEAVKLCAKQQKGASGMVNAILRRVQREGRRELPDDPWQALGIECSQPDWLIAMWRAQYSDEVCVRICRSMLKLRVQSVRVNVMKADRDELAQDAQYKKGKLSPDALLCVQGNPAQSAAYRKGLISIQDEASQMVAIWMDPHPGERILDVCSAPGSKACHMAEHMHDQGKIICGDIHPHRVELINRGAERLGLHILDARVMDACVLDGVQDKYFDGVLCDVPCSGLGVMGRKSDIKTHLDSSAMDTLIPLQREILAAASAKVKAGGRLVYSTCTLNRKENEKQVMHFLQTHEDFHLVKEKTFFPFEYDSDGFYVALLRRDSVVND